MAFIYCSQCVASFINGVPCHEHGCPLSKRPWVKADGGKLVPQEEFHDEISEEFDLSHEMRDDDYDY